LAIAWRPILTQIFLDDYEIVTFCLWSFEKGQIGSVQFLNFCMRDVLAPGGVSRDVGGHVTQNLVGLRVRCYDCRSEYFDLQVLSLAMVVSVTRWMLGLMTITSLWSIITSSITISFVWLH
jgi:hypothetical protein